MKSVNLEITDLKGEFTGGTSFAIDWYQKLRLGAEAMLDNINPDTLKRQVPIYGGLTRSLKVYYCPSDVEVPTRIFDPTNASIQFDYVPAAYFYTHPDRRDIFTIEYVNGVRFIVARHALSASAYTLAEMDGSDTFTGTASSTLAENTYNVLPGASASLQGTFSDSSYVITRALTQSLDISGLLRGVVILPLNVDSARLISAITIRLKDANGHYYQVVSTQDSIGDYLRDGQNMVRFWMNNATKSGTPDATAITTVEIDIPMTTGNSQTVILGKTVIQQSHLFVFEYQSNLVFVDRTTGAWKDTPASGDSINLNRDALGVFHYEVCRLVIQATKNERVNAAESQRIDTNLTRKYASYYSRFPSAEKPYSYDISPDIPYNPDPFFDGFGSELSDTIGDSSNAIQPESSVFFADAEVPTPVIDGVTQAFTLLHVPNPAASLEVVINGQVLTLGVDYTLASNVLTLLTPYYTAAFIGLPFWVNYRYSV